MRGRIRSQETTGTDKVTPILVPVSKESQQKLERGYWMDRANRRAFLDAFALEHGFNPSDPEGWASITNVQIIAKKVKSNSIISLSLTIYPVLGFAIIDNIWRVA